MTKSYTVTSVRESGNAVKIELLCDDGEVKRHRMTSKIWESFNLSRGDIILNEDYLKIADISERCEAVTRAMRLLSESSLSCRKLCEKLRSAGFSRSAAEDAVSVALKKGLIDEVSQAEDYAARYAETKLRGRERVVASLVSHGYPADLSRRAADRVPAAVYTKALKKQLAKRCPDGLPDEKAERDKLIAAMVRQGFSVGEILSVIGEIK